MKRVFVNKMNQIIIIPTIGILWNWSCILLSFAWLHVECSVLLHDRRKERPE